MQQTTPQQISKSEKPENHTIPRDIVTTRITHVIVENAFYEEKCRLVQVLQHQLQLRKIHCSVIYNSTQRYLQNGQQSTFSQVNMLELVRV